MGSVEASLPASARSTRTRDAIPPWHVGTGRIALALSLFATWHVSARIAGPLYFAEPFAVVARVIEDARSGTIILALIDTVQLAALGFAAGCGAGVVLPLLLTPFGRMIAALEPYIVASAGIPKYALVPLFVLWFGIDDAPKVWLVGLLTFYPVFIGVLAGCRQVDRRLIDAIRVLGADGFTLVRLVVWPSMLPFFFAALRIAVPRAVSAAIIGEFLIGDKGLGHLIESARQNLDMVGVFAGVAVATALVMAFSGLIDQVERRALRWRPREHTLAF